MSRRRRAVRLCGWALLLCGTGYVAELSLRPGPGLFAIVAGVVLVTLTERPRR